ncbi:MAG: CatB-related O-acetyltransferase [Planctomycetes bacterium]|nr:CatB-related O-acetyltransferase [Planctomycetota bacterium]
MDENVPELLTVGNMCAFGKNCSIIVDGEHTNHRLINLELNAFPYPFSLLKQTAQIDSTVTCKGKTVIGSNVVISSGATILSGVKIGNGVVIGADALITKDVPDFAIVGGNPARVLRYRFSENIIGKLLEIRWWDFEFKFLFARLAKIQKMPIDEFADMYGDISKNIYDANKNRFVFEVRGLDKGKIDLKCVGCDIDDTFVKLDDLNDAINFYVNQFNAKTVNHELYFVDNILDSMQIS